MPLTVIPEGSISIPIGKLRDMIAGCDAWQDWTQSGSAAQALEHVYAVSALAYTAGVEYDLATIQALRPFIIVNIDPRAGFEFDQVGEGAFVDHGKLTLHVEDNIPDGTDDTTYQNTVFEFMNNLGNLLAEVLEASTVGGNLIIQSIHATKPIMRSDPKLAESMGDFHFAAYDVIYGPR